MENSLFKKLTDKTIRNKLILKKLIKQTLFFLLTLTFVIIGPGCSTKKSTITSRLYHNITAKYNAYFNGNESLKQGVKSMEKAYPEDYTKILPVFRVADKSQASSIYPAMDVAIKKASKVIIRHNITGKPKERKWKEKLKKNANKRRQAKGLEPKPEGIYKNWIDDSYMLLGKSYFYKNDYYPALESFEYVEKKYKDYPIKMDALVWKARSYNELGLFDKAQSVLDMIRNEKKISPKDKGKIAEVYADYYIKQEDYNSAIAHLTTAIKYSKKKYPKIRYTFILAQIYQRYNNFPKALMFYKDVTKRNAPYEMAFHAKINQASCYSKGGDSKPIKKLLTKMLKDDKNKDYLDQIYYALAEIELKEKNTPKAIEYLILSTQKSTTNNNQKALSFLKLAEIHFAMPKYEPAQAYYDSTITFLNTDYPKYNEIYNKKITLTELVENIKIVTLEDSLQRLASMSNKEQEAKINSIIKQIKEDRKKKKEEELISQQNQIFQNQNNPNKPTLPNSGSTKFELYNPSALSFGYSEFVKRWGNRKLEDNWRRSDKSISADFANDNSIESETSKSSENEKADDVLSVDYYMKNIPQTKEDIDKSNVKIMNALYNLGIIYKEKLSDNPKSVESHELLVKRFPNSSKELPTFYYLYLTYKSMNDKKNSDYYKDQILSKYPNSDYAKLIRNPNYFVEITRERDQVKKLYKETYLAYLSGNYEQVISNNTTANSKFSDDVLISKFDYLRALAVGKSKDLETFKIELKNFLLKHPNSEEKPEAERTLNFINSMNKESSETNSNDSDPNKEIPSIYQFNPDAEQYHTIVYSDKDVNMNELKMKVSNFNSKYFSIKNLSISNMVLNNQYQVVIIKTFKNVEEGMDYYNTISNDKEISEYLKNNFFHFLISFENYTSFYKDKDIDVYKEFFDNNYKTLRK